jgi:hypothetical protein
MADPTDTRPPNGSIGARSAGRRFRLTAPTNRIDPGREALAAAFDFLKNASVSVRVAKPLLRRRSGPPMPPWPVAPKAS